MIDIHLLQTSESGNIGAVARAMKTMGLAHLYLYAPKTELNAVAYARASGADDLLDNAVTYHDLKKQLAPYQWIVGTSGRDRKADIAVLDCPTFKKEVASRTNENQKIAILFGQESCGLSNEECDYCQHLLQIPSNQDFCSLNLSHAVQIVAYEIKNALSAPTEAVASANPLATTREYHHFFEYIEKTLRHNGFLSMEQSISYMRKLRHIFYKTPLSKSEMDFVFGTLKGLSKNNHSPQS